MYRDHEFDPVTPEEQARREQEEEFARRVRREVRRMAAYMADECARWLRGEVLRYEVTREMLRTMA